MKAQAIRFDLPYPAHCPQSGNKLLIGGHIGQVADNKLQVNLGRMEKLLHHAGGQAVPCPAQAIPDGQFRCVAKAPALVLLHFGPGQFIAVFAAPERHQTFALGGAIVAHRALGRIRPQAHPQHQVGPLLSGNFFNFLAIQQAEPVYLQALGQQGKTGLHKGADGPLNSLAVFFQGVIRRGQQHNSASAGCFFQHIVQHVPVHPGPHPHPVQPVRVFSFLHNGVVAHHAVAGGEQGVVHQQALPDHRGRIHLHAQRLFYGPQPGVIDGAVPGLGPVAGNGKADAFHLHRAGLCFCLCKRDHGQHEKQTYSSETKRGSFFFHFFHFATWVFLYFSCRRGMPRQNRVVTQQRRGAEFFSAIFLFFSVNSGLFVVISGSRAGAWERGCQEGNPLPKS